MHIYQRKSLLAASANFEAFVTLYGAALKAGQSDAFFLHRPDDARLLIVTVDTWVLLCHVRAEDDCLLSCGSTGRAGMVSFMGLSGKCTANAGNFIDATVAIAAIKTFFKGMHDLTEHTAFREGMVDPDVLSFPCPMADLWDFEPSGTISLELIVDVPSALQRDMELVCSHLDKTVGDDLDLVGYDDAIQIGGLCGGLVDGHQDVFSFSFYQKSGEVWSFKMPRTGLDAIAEGSITKLRVTASIPKKSEGRGPALDEKRGLL